jgi:hypothetical protein
MTASPSMSPGAEALLTFAAEKARAAGVFGEVSVRGGMLEAAALASAEPAAFRLFFEAGKLWVSLVTANRWLSQSIEADLVHTGDKLDELLQEELVDLGYTGTPPRFEHFRSEDKLFTFRSIVPVNVQNPSEADRETAVQFLLGYEACFRQLGDMEADDEE